MANCCFLQTFPNRRYCCERNTYESTRADGTLISSGPKTGSRPGLLRLPFHEPDCGDERVQQAGIMTLARDAAEVVVHGIGITARQLGRPFDPQLAQIGGDCWADVGDVFEPCQITPLVELPWFSPSRCALSAHGSLPSVSRFDAAYHVLNHVSWKAVALAEIRGRKPMNFEGSGLGRFRVRRPSRRRRRASYCDSGSKLVAPMW